MIDRRRSNSIILKLCLNLLLEKKLNEQDLHLVSLESFFDVDYNQATPTVQKLFLFVYSECPEGMGADIVGRTGKQANLSHYEGRVSKADIALIRLVLWLEVERKKKKDQEAAETGDQGSPNQGGGSGQRRQSSRRGQNQENTSSNSNQESPGSNSNQGEAPAAEKSKGGRPTNAPSVEKNLPKFDEYLLSEMQMRAKAAKKEALAASWYSAALENINTKLRKTKNKGKVGTPKDGQGDGNTNSVTPSNTMRVSETQMTDILKEELGEWAKV